MEGENSVMDHSEMVVSQERREHITKRGDETRAQPRAGYETDKESWGSHFLESPRVYPLGFELYRFGLARFCLPGVSK